MKTAILFAVLTTVASSVSSVLAGAQAPSVGRHVEDIYIVRSVRLTGGAGPKVGEDLVDHRRLGDERDDAHRAVAGRAPGDAGFSS